MYQYVLVCDLFGTFIYCSVLAYTAIYLDILQHTYTSTNQYEQVQGTVKSMYLYILVLTGTGKSLKSHTSTKHFLL